jgi:hypothetical protein
MGADDDLALGLLASSPSMYDASHARAKPKANPLVDITIDMDMAKG